MKDCPVGKTECPCSDFSKQGLCDWPYGREDPMANFNVVIDYGLSQLAAAVACCALCLGIRSLRWRGSLS